MALIGILTLLMAGAIVTGPHPRLRQTVPSAWEDIPMRCDTTRSDAGDHPLELFECRAPSGGLPPGLYRSPESQWSSDLTGRPALASAIRITRDGHLTGFAIY